jgi:hypothetical protein
MSVTYCIFNLFPATQQTHFTLKNFMVECVIYDSYIIHILAKADT